MWVMWVMYVKWVMDVIFDVWVYVSCMGHLSHLGHLGHVGHLSHCHRISGPSSHFRCIPYLLFRESLQPSCLWLGAHRVGFHPGVLKSGSYPE